MTILLPVVAPVEGLSGRYDVHDVTVAADAIESVEHKLLPVLPFAKEEGDREGTLVYLKSGRKLMVNADRFALIDLWHKALRETDPTGYSAL